MKCSERPLRFRAGYRCPAVLVNCHRFGGNARIQSKKFLQLHRLRVVGSTAIFHIELFVISPAALAEEAAIRLEDETALPQAIEMFDVVCEFLKICPIGAFYVNTTVILRLIRSPLVSSRVLL
jgi:hypothetical protein